MLTLYTGPKPPSSTYQALLQQLATACLYLPHHLAQPGSKRRPIRFPLSPKTVSCMGLDFLAAVSSYPKPDDKIRTTSLKVQGGGNASNALTCVARLGLSPRAISKVADDTQGRAILEELQADGVDTSFIVVSEEGNSPFTYIIVDNQT